MEKEALEKLLSTTRLHGNEFKGVIHIFRNPALGEIKILCLYEMNGNNRKVEYIWEDWRETKEQGLFGAVAKDIALLIIPEAFKKMKEDGFSKIVTLPADRVACREFIYFKPIYQELCPVTCWLKTEDELTLQERYTNAVAGINMRRIYPNIPKVEEVADVRITVEDILPHPINYRCVVELMNNEYTQAKKPYKIYEITTIFPPTREEMEIMINNALANWRHYG